MLTVTKKFSFCYGHRLPEHKGKCKQQHGHNSEVEIEIGFKTINDTCKDGMIIDFGNLKIIMAPILEKLDHQYLNDVLEECYLPPTAENITKHLVDKIEWALPDNLAVLRVRVSETPTSWAEWKRG